MQIVPYIHLQQRNRNLPTPENRPFGVHPERGLVRFCPSHPLDPSTRLAIVGAVQDKGRVSPTMRETGKTKLRYSSNDSTESIFQSCDREEVKQRSPPKNRLLNRIFHSKQCVLAESAYLYRDSSKTARI